MHKIYLCYGEHTCSESKHTYTETTRINRTTKQYIYNLLQLRSYLYDHTFSVYGLMITIFVAIHDREYRTISITIIIYRVIWFYVSVAHAWIGLHDFVNHNDVYQWVTSGHVTAHDPHWGLLQPDYTKHHQNEDCVQIVKGDQWRWHDEPCTTHAPFICQRHD